MNTMSYERQFLNVKCFVIQITMLYVLLLSVFWFDLLNYLIAVL